MINNNKQPLHLISPVVRHFFNAVTIEKTLVDFQLHFLSTESDKFYRAII